MTRIAVLIAFLLAAATSRADVVSDWDKNVERAIENAPNRGSAWTHASIAVFNALNAFEKRFAFYGEPLDAPAGASPEAAVATAAWLVVSSYTGIDKGYLDAKHDEAMKKVTDPAAREKGAQVGRRAALAILARRAGDSSVRVEPPAREPAPGVWQLTPGSKMPSSIARQSYAHYSVPAQPFADPGPPPAPGSEPALAAIRETKRLGARDSDARTADQTAAVVFWNASFGSITRESLDAVVAARKATPLEHARMQALVTIAYADMSTLQVAYKAKYNYWRPWSAIAGPLADASVRDAAWEPLVRTPPNPDWPSGGGMFAGIDEVLYTAFAGDASGPWTLYSKETGLTRRYASFTAMAEEAAASRVWAGVHFRASVEAGRRSGREIARHVLATQLLPVPGK